MINSKNTLELLSEGKIIYSSDKSGLRPLIEMISIIKEKYSSYDNLELNDKVTGLAAAKLIIHLGKIIKIHTNIASSSAMELLLKHNIQVYAAIIVKQILNKDKTAQCPMELKSEKLNPEEFYTELKKIMNN